MSQCQLAEVIRDLRWVMQVRSQAASSGVNEWAAC